MDKNFEKNSNDNNTEWETPWNTFRAIQERFFRFEVDVCASQENAKVGYYFTRGLDGLNRDWGRLPFFMNPPYGKVLPYWLEKAVTESEVGAKGVCLIPSRTDPDWWHKWVMPFAAEVHYVRGRIKFVGATSGAKFGSAIVLYKPRGMWYRGPKFRSIEVPLK